MFTPKLLDVMRRDLNNDLKAFEKEHNVKVEIGKMTYSECQFTVKMTVTEDSDDTERKLFEQSCRMYGLKSSDYKHHISFQQGGKDVDFEIYGFDNSKRKAPIKIRKIEDGSLYVIPMDKISHIAWKGSKLTETDINGNSK